MGVGVAGGVGVGVGAAPGVADWDAAGAASWDGAGAEAAGGAGAGVAEGGAPAAPRQASRTAQAGWPLGASRREGGLLRRDRRLQRVQLRFHGDDCVVCAGLALSHGGFDERTKARHQRPGDLRQHLCMRRGGQSVGGRGWVDWIEQRLHQIADADREFSPPPAMLETTASEIGLLA